MKSLISLISICLVKSIVADSSCADWLPYKDENCYKIVDDTLRTFADAEKICEGLEESPTLPIIRSSEEQDFLSTYLFKTQKKDDNFWIGARFLNNSFKWIDNTDLSYTNWGTNGTKNIPNFCVQIQADLLVTGKWNDAPCEKMNKVVCQKMQNWSLARLQEEFLNERKQLQEAKNEINILKQNPVPINFIYVQLSNQPEPKILWSNLQWKDVTSEYAGLFFRAEGGTAEKFGTIQTENAPRVTEVKAHWHARADGESPVNHWDHINLNVGGWSTGIGAFTGDYANGREAVTHEFYTSGGEVRPRNMAMRIWKRI